MADKDDHGDRSSEDESFLESEEDEVDYKVGGYHRVAVGGKSLQMFTYTPFRIVSPSAPPPPEHSDRFILSCREI